jgi:hypothetical protein
MNETREYDQLTESDAWDIIDAMAVSDPDFVSYGISRTMQSAPQAGPIRILRELDFDIATGWGPQHRAVSK